MRKSEPDPNALYFFRSCTFKFKCYISWDDLKVTQNPAVGFCEDCKKHVYYCETPEQLNFAIAKDLCVAIRRDHPRAEHKQLSLGSIVDTQGPLLVRMRPQTMAQAPNKLLNLRTAF